MPGRCRPIWTTASSRSGSSAERLRRRRSCARPVPDWASGPPRAAPPGRHPVLLWTEYRERCPDGFGYSWFAERYRAYAERLDIVMRQEHRAGEKLFIDFAGADDPDRRSRHRRDQRRRSSSSPSWVRRNYTYAEACPARSCRTGSRPTFAAFEFLGGVPALLVPDNLQPAVIKAAPLRARSQPRHTTIWPPTTARRSSRLGRESPGTRPRSRSACWWSSAGSSRPCATGRSSRSPRRTRAIRERARLAQRPALPQARRLTASALRVPRPTGAAAAAGSAVRVRRSGSRAKVNIDYHVEVDRHYYSVPYQLVGETADVRIGDARSRSSSGAGGWRAIRAATSRTGPRPTPRTCPSPTAAISSGRPRA